MKNKTIQGVGCNDNNWALILSENRQLSVRTIGNFFRGIKRSRGKFTYTQVNKILTTPEMVDLVIKSVLEYKK